MITLYTAATSNGLRPAIMLAESGLSHIVKKIDLEKGEQRTPEFLAMNPAARIPVIVDDDAGGEKLVLTESLAIVIHVAEKSGVGLPTQPKARAHVFEAAASAMTDVYGPFNGLFHLHHGGRTPPSQIAQGFDGLLKDALSRVDAKLASSEWLAGDFSIADIVLYPTLGRLETALKRTYPTLENLQRWAKAMAARPGVKLGTSLAGRP